MPPSAARSRALGRFTVAATTLGLVTATLALGLSAPASGRAQRRPDDHRGVRRRRQRRCHLQRRLRRALQRLLVDGLAGRQEPAVPRDHQHRGAHHVQRLRAARRSRCLALLLPRQGRRRRQRRRHPEDPRRVLLPRPRRERRAGLPGRHDRRDQPGHRWRERLCGRQHRLLRGQGHRLPRLRHRHHELRGRAQGRHDHAGPVVQAHGRRSTPTTTTPTSRSARSRPVRTTATASRRP